MNFNYPEGVVLSGEITFENDVSFNEFEVSSLVVQEYIIGAEGGDSTLTFGGEARSSWPGTGIPLGGIIMWSGSAEEIPAGWVLCSGGGTPNLSDKFIVGAGDTYTVGASAGEAEVTLSTNNIPSHLHTITATASVGAHYDHNFPARKAVAGTPASVELSQADATLYPVTTNSNGAHTHNIILNSIGGTAHENRPPFYTLAYIMYIGV